MPSRHLVHRELTKGLELWPPGDIGADRVPVLRQMTRAAPLGPEVPGVEMAERLVPGPAGAPPVRVLVYTPTAVAAPRPAVLQIHGGGYVIGAPEGSDAENRAIAAEVGCVVVAVDYRLAPETQHPGPLEDCYAVLKWMHDAAGELGVDTARLAVKGESAGGGLGACLALLARDRGEIKLAFQLLIYPMVDDREPAEPHPYAGQFIWTQGSNRFAWTSLLGHAPGIDGVSPYAVAARAEDLSGLPPTFISLGSLDLFLEQDLEFTRRLSRAGVPVELHVYPGVYHAYKIAGDSTIARRIDADIHTALREAFEPG